MTHTLIDLLARETNKLKQAGLYKREILPPTDRWREHGDEMSRLINFTSHDYLGLGSDRRIRDAALHAVDVYGVGLFSSRMAAGSRTLHRELEQSLASFVGLPASLVYASGYHANIGLFEPLFDHRDYLFCDTVVHPSLADGVRLSGAHVFTYASNDLVDLEDKLKRSKGARFRAIVTDGVFALSGVIASLGPLCNLAKRYEALVVVDDSLGLGVLGELGMGSREYNHVMSEVDIVTGSFSAVLGGMAGGYVAARNEIIDWLRQKSIPFLFSGALPPAATGAAKAAVDLLINCEAPLGTLTERRTLLCDGLRRAGYRVLGGEHPLLAVDVGDAVTLQKMINALAARRIHAYGLCYPVVPEGEARVLLHVSVEHTQEDLAFTLDAFETLGRQLALT